MSKESKLVFSKKFRNLLNCVKTPLSEAIINLDNKPSIVDSNFIDISDDDNGSVTFINNRKVKEILESPVRAIIYSGGRVYKDYVEKFIELGFKNKELNPRLPDGTHGVIVAKTTHNKYKDRTLCHFVSDLGQEVLINISGLSIISKNPYDYDGGDLWNKNRMSVKIGRIIKKLIPLTGITFSDKDVEIFVNKYKSEYDLSKDAFSNFDIVDGDDIRKYYNKQTYTEIRGTMGNSCMNGSGCSEFFDIYTKNPESVKMLILRERGTDKIKGRAIVWILTKPKNTIIMDRIYTVNDSDIELFKSFAKKNGWGYKKYQDNNNTSPLENCTVGQKKITIKLNTSMYYTFPYLDTMIYYNAKDGTLSNRGRRSYDRETGSQYVYELRSTSGDAY